MAGGRGENEEEKENCYSFDNLTSSSLYQRGNKNEAYDDSNDFVEKSILEEICKLEEEEGKTEKELCTYSAECSFVCNKVLLSLNDISNSFLNLKEETYSVERKLKKAYESIKYVFDDLQHFCVTKTNIEVMLNFVNNVLKLQEIYEGLSLSIKEKNIESAVKHISSFHSLYKHFKTESVFYIYSENNNNNNNNIRAQIQGENIPSSSTPYHFYSYDILTARDKSMIQAIEENEFKIRRMVMEEFDMAISKNNKEDVCKYAKLFHPLKMHKEGIATYVCFLTNLLSDKCAKNFRRLNEPNVKTDEDEEKSKFVETLTDVFVFVSDILQTHQQNIEEEFGIENFIIFLRGFQEEVDVQAIRIINKFIKDRSAVFECTFDQVTTTLPAMDGCLEELVRLIESSQNFEKYLKSLGRFVLTEKFKKRKKILNEKEKEEKDAEKNKGEEEGISAYTHPDEDDEEDDEDTKDGGLYSKEDGLLTLSVLTKKMQELTDKYVAIEHVFILLSINKALKETDEISVEEFEGETSTLVDDVFFILKKSFLRAINCCHVYAVCAVINNIINILSSHVKETLQENLSASKRYYANYVQDATNLKNFDLKSTLPEVAFKALQSDALLNSSYSWLHSVNNVSVCMEYIQHFKVLCSTEFDRHFLTPEEEEEGKQFDTKTNKRSNTNRDMFHHTLQNIENVRIEFESLHTSTCNATLNVLKVHLIPSLQRLDSTNFNISEEEYADYQVNDPFMRNLMASLDTLIEHVNKIFHANTSSLIISLLVEKVCKRIESIIMNKRFNLLGAVQLDSDIRNLLKFFTHAASTSIRSKFLRLIEIGDLLSVGSANEFEDFWAAASGKNWQLTQPEIQEVLSLRIDFPPEFLQNIFQSKD